MVAIPRLADDARDAGLYVVSKDGHEWQVQIETESLKVLKQSGLEIALGGMGPRTVALRIRRKREGIVTARALPKVNGSH